MMTKTTDEMVNYSTGAVRDTNGKGRMDLLPMCSLIRISKHMENSLTHYPERNWEKGIPMHNMINSAMRHIAKYVDGMTDEDHLCAAATNLLMAMWTEEKMPEMQDIPTRLGPRVEPTINSVCSCWVVDGGGKHRCYSTKEMEVCECGGDKSKCDFYPATRAANNVKTR